MNSFSHRPQTIDVDLFYDVHARPAPVNPPSSVHLAFGQSLRLSIYRIGLV